MNAINYIRTYHKPYIGKNINYKLIDKYEHNYLYYFENYCNPITKLLKNNKTTLILFYVHKKNNNLKFIEIKTDNNETHLLIYKNLYNVSYIPCIPNSYKKLTFTFNRLRCNETKFYFNMYNSIQKINIDIIYYNFIKLYFNITYPSLKSLIISVDRTNELIWYNRNIVLLYFNDIQPIEKLIFRNFDNKMFDKVCKKIIKHNIIIKLPKLKKLSNDNLCYKFKQNKLIVKTAGNTNIYTKLYNFNYNNMILYLTDFLDIIEVNDLDELIIYASYYSTTLNINNVKTIILNNKDNSVININYFNTFECIKINIYDRFRLYFNNFIINNDDINNYYNMNINTYSKINTDDYYLKKNINNTKIYFKYLNINNIFEFKKYFTITKNNKYLIIKKILFI